jgi:opacity protein-like surface antigen
MSKIILISTMLLIFSSLSFSQNDKSFFEEGSKALLFEFSGLDDIGADSFNGGIGGKYFLKSNLAIRGGVQFITINEDIPFQGTGGIDGEAHANRFGISAALEVHLNDTRVNPYWGGGLALSITSTESKSVEADPLDQVTVKNSRGGEFGYFGGTELTFFGMLGVEIFVFKNLSFAAEYRLGFSSLSRKDEQSKLGDITVTTKQGSISGFGIESSGILTLAVYF